MSGPFYLWSSNSNLFVTSGSPISADFWNVGAATGGTFPIFVDAETNSSSGASTSTPVAWSIYATDSDLFGTIEPAQLVATTTEVDPLGATGDIAGEAVFSTGTTCTGAFLYFSASTTTAGDYQLNFVPFTETIPTSNETTSTLALGTSLVLDKSLAQPVNWSFVANGTSSTAATELVGLIGVADGMDTDYYLQGVTTAGVAATPVEVASLFASDWANIAYNTASQVFDADYATQDSSSSFTFYSDAYTASTNKLGVATSFLTVSGFSSITGMDDDLQPSGTDLRFVSGFQTVSGASKQVIEDFLGNGSPAAAATVTLSSATADRWDTVEVLDPATNAYDETALVYADGGEVHLDLFNKTGQQIGSDMVASGLTSFDTVQDLGPRLEILYTASNGSGGQSIDSIIYDTRSAGVSPTLSGGSGEFAGTPFDDTFTFATGVYTLDGGGGTDTFSASTFAASQVSITANGSAVATFSDSSGDKDTLIGFSSIVLNGAVDDISANQIKQVNSNGTYSIANFNGSYGTLGATALVTRVTSYDASGNTLKTAWLNASGTLEKATTDDGGGAYDNFTATAGAFRGIAYSGSSTFFSATDVRQKIEFFDASGNLLGTRTLTSNGAGGDWVLTKPGSSAETARATYANGDFSFYFQGVSTAYANLTKLFSPTGALLVFAKTRTGATSALVQLESAGLTVKTSGSLMVASDSVLVGSQTMSFQSTSNETIHTNGKGDETFELTSGYGNLAISDFDATSANPDHLQFQASAFTGMPTGGTAASDWAWLASSGAAFDAGSDVHVKDSAGDVLVLRNMSVATLTAHASNVFSFV